MHAQMELCIKFRLGAYEEKLGLFPTLTRPSLISGVKFMVILKQNLYSVNDPINSMYETINLCKLGTQKQMINLFFSWEEKRNPGIK